MLICFCPENVLCFICTQGYANTMHSDQTAYKQLSIMYKEREREREREREDDNSREWRGKGSPIDFTFWTVNYLF